MNIEKINETILELKKELENKRKNVKTREIVKDGCSCGSNKVTHKQTIKKSSKAKKIYVCENCKERWTESLEEKFMDSQETKFQNNKDKIFKTLNSLKRIVENYEEKRDEYNDNERA